MQITNLYSQLKSVYQNLLELNFSQPSEGSKKDIKKIRDLKRSAAEISRKLHSIRKNGGKSV